MPFPKMSRKTQKIVQGLPYNAYKTPNKIKKQNQQKKNNKRQNRPSEIRLSGVPPIMPIKTPNTI